MWNIFWWNFSLSLQVELNEISAWCSKRLLGCKEETAKEATVKIKDMECKESDIMEWGSC